MKTVSVEAPYSGDKERNVRYTLLATKDCILNYNEAPYSSALLNWQTIIDGERSYSYKPDENPFAFGDKGYEIPASFHKIVDKVVFYTDLGWSDGMKKVKKFCEIDEIEMEVRSLPEDWMKVHFKMVIKEK